MFLVVVSVELIFAFDAAFSSTLFRLNALKELLLRLLDEVHVVFVINVLVIHLVLDKRTTHRVIAQKRYRWGA